MKQVQLREAKTTLSAVVEAAEPGEPTTITKHGRPAAVVISHAEWTRLKTRVPSFADLLLAVPPLDPGDLPKRRPARIVRKGRFKGCQVIPSTQMRCRSSRRRECHEMPPRPATLPSAPGCASMMKSS